MKSHLTLLAIGGLLVALAPARAQDDPNAEKKPADAAEAAAEKKKEDEKPKTIAELIKDSDRTDGLFTVFRDRKTGDLRLQLRADQLGQTFLQFSYIENGLPAAGVFRGQFATDDARILSIRRFFDRVEFVVQNSRFTFAPGAAIARAHGGNISPAVVAEEKIEAEDKEQGLVLINAGSVFLRETFHRILPLPDPKKPPHEVFTAGALNAAKTKIRAVRNYPENTDVIVEYVYENEKPYVQGGDELTDPRFVSVVVQHSLIAAPTEEFAARPDDPRVGYFGARVTDLSATGPVPYRDIISRWRLVKKDPTAAISEPVEPIVFWIENTTPVELRPVIERAGLAWNEAFLAAGFKDALVIKTQPDDATWDAGDLRYNVIRWMSSPSPVFGGYGPSFYDPRNGRILGADIVLEYRVIGSMLNQARVFGAPPTPAGPAALVHQAGCCLAPEFARMETIFGRAMLDALGADTAEKQRLLEEFMHFLVLHEIGHTLGLSHNFRSSHLHSLADLYDGTKTYAAGLTSSVMEYPAIPFVRPGGQQGQFWTTRPGPYDIWAITYGYSSALDDPAVEARRREAILARSTEPTLAFANDADVMSSPGKAIDPRAMVNDMSADPIGFARDQMAVVEAVVPQFRQRLTRAGESHQALLIGHYTAMGRYHASAAGVSRFIGGVYVDRAMSGQAGAGAPLTPVAAADQQRAMQTLREKIFAPGAFQFLAANADHLLAQRRGFDHYTYTEDPKLHEAALAVQRDILEHLLHPTVLRRVTDTRVYGQGNAAYALLTDLTDAVFADDLRGDVNTFRQNLQLEYTKRLLVIVDPAKENPYDAVAQSAALDRLRWLQRQLGAKAEVNPETAAHRDHVLYRIRRGLDESSGRASAG